MVKAVVDVEEEIMALGGELHADGNAMLFQEGSKQENLWDKYLSRQIRR